MMENHYLVSVESDDKKVIFFEKVPNFQADQLGLLKAKYDFDEVKDFIENIKLPFHIELHDILYGCLVGRIGNCLCTKAFQKGERLELDPKKIETFTNTLYNMQCEFESREENGDSFVGTEGENQYIVIKALVSALDEALEILKTHEEVNQMNNGIQKFHLFLAVK